MAKKNEKLAAGLWDDVTSADFESEANIDDVDVGEFNTEEMGLFAFNINCARQLPAIEDSLIPVQRRVLWVMYLMKAYKGNQTKCAGITGKAMDYHPHGDASIYQTMVGMAQPFKRGVPFLRGYGNFGTIIAPNQVGASRYTEACISDYGYECFFEDFDYDCVPMQPNAIQTADEPVYLPSKFPNILLEGAPGLGYGFSTCIPPYYIGDVIDLTKRLLKDPEDPDIYLVPDPPCDGCEIVWDKSLNEICDTGTGVLTMRAHIDIEDKGPNYVLRIRSVPWLTSLEDIIKDIGDLCSAGQLPFKDKSDMSRPLARKKPTDPIKHDIDYRLILNKAFDPLKAKQDLYRLTDLQKSISIQFWAVSDGVEVQRYNMRTLVLSWIETRREYIRRLLNKRLARLTARMDLLAVLIKLTEKTNLDKVVKIIKNARGDVAEQALMDQYGMSSYHAHQVIDMPLRKFTAEMHEEYSKEYAQVSLEIQTIMDTIKSSKKIDEKIIEDLDDLKKYCPPHRYCSVVDNSNDQAVSDTEHILVFTKKGNYKKLPSDLKSKGFGTFGFGDYPIRALKCRNMENVVIHDTTGRFSIVPVHEFENTAANNPGNKTFQVTKLQGEIVGVDNEQRQPETDLLMSDYGLVAYIMTLTRSGFIKKTPLSEFQGLKHPKAVRGVRLLKTNDSLVCAERLLSYPNDGKKRKAPKVKMDPPNVLVYTRDGMFTIIDNDDIPIIGRDTQGIRCIDLQGDDYCVGCCLFPPAAKYALVVTNKGLMKIVEADDLNGYRKRKSTYLLQIAEGDSLYCVLPIREGDEIHIGTKSRDNVIQFADVPVMARRAKGKKVISLGTENIINIRIEQHV